MPKQDLTLIPLNPLTWSAFGTAQGAGGMGGGVYAGYGSGLNFSQGSAPTTAITQSNYAEIDGALGISGSLSATWDKCGTTTGVQGGFGMKGGNGFGGGGFIGTAWSATAATPTLGSGLSALNSLFPDGGL